MATVVVVLPWTPEVVNRLGGLRHRLLGGERLDLGDGADEGGLHREVSDTRIFTAVWVAPPHHVVPFTQTWRGAR